MAFSQPFDVSTTFDQIIEMIRGHPHFAIVKLLFLKCQRALSPEFWEEPGLFSTGDVSEMIVRLEASTIGEKGEKADESPGEIQKTEMVDEVIFDAAIVLRIHLAELHRLSELCGKFVMNYEERISKTIAQQRNSFLSQFEGGERQTQTEEKVTRRMLTDERN
ncbi:hypothetical protein niasHT_000267 [Heterodera trifolii]|uniref:MEIS N-terminal domain-containing protein n=1 Tax=Heterodera trifolii TaxID=157864 RepID=A0ABD2LTD5_9BILA